MLLKCWESAPWHDSDSIAGKYSDHGTGSGDVFKKVCDTGTWR